MVAQPGNLQASWNSGEIAAELDQRFDLKQWYQAARRMLNVEPVPQGGFRLMPGSRIRGRSRMGMSLATGLTNTPDTGSKSGEATVYRVDIDPSQRIAVVFLLDFAASANNGAEIFVEYLVSTGVWANFGVANFATGTAGRSRVAARPPGQGIVTRAIRVRVTGQSSDVSMTFSGGVLPYVEGTTLPDCRIVPFSFGTDQHYVFAFVAGGFVDIWRNGVHVGAAQTAVSGATLRGFKYCYRFDSFFLWHKDIQSELIMRRGADHEWAYSAVPFKRIPRVDLGGSYSITTDRWDIFVRWATLQSDGDPYGPRPAIYLTVTVDGETTDALQLGPAAGSPYASWISAIQSAINGLPSLGSNAATVTLHAEEDDEDLPPMIQVRVVFDGGNFAGEQFDLAAQITNTAEASALAAHTRIGSTGGEPLMSSGKGWPAAGIFYQDRLIIAGFSSKRSAVLASRTGSYYDLNIKTSAANAAILDNIDTDGGEQINHLIRASHLLVFTDANEYFLSNRVVSRDEPRNFVETGSHAAHPDAAIVEIADDYYFVSAEGTLLYAMSYDDVATRYLSEPASLLASHLVEKARNLALQKGAEETDASRIYMVRDDGRLIVAHIIRNQEVLGFTERGLAGGAIEDVCVDGQNIAYTMVRRTVGGVTRMFFEELQPGLFLQNARSFTVANATVTGLEDYEGESIWCFALGYVAGPFTVSGGAFTFPPDAAEIFVGAFVTFGRWEAPVMETLPKIRVLDDGVVELRPGRIHTVRVKVKDTKSIAIGANGRPPRNRALYRAGMPGDAPLDPQTRWVTAEALDGFSEEPTVVVTQTQPGILQVTSLIAEVS